MLDQTRHSYAQSPAQSCPLVQHPPLPPSLPSTFFALPLPPSKASRQHFVATELKLVSSRSGTQREWQLTFLFPGDSDLIRAAPGHRRRLCAGRGARGGSGHGLGAPGGFGAAGEGCGAWWCCGCDSGPAASLRKEARTCWSRSQTRSPKDVAILPRKIPTHLGLFSLEKEGRPQRSSKGAGNKLLVRAYSNRTRGHGFKLKEGRFGRDLRKNCSVLRVVKRWSGGRCSIPGNTQGHLRRGSQQSDVGLGGLQRTFPTQATP